MSADLVAGWRVEVLRGPAWELHGRDLPADPEPMVWILEPTAPAVVLGSTEPEAHVLADRLAAAGIDLVRRRSGGGAVLVEPASSTWVDVVVPVGHTLWRDDVGVAMHWVGDLWARALADLGVEAEVHRAGLLSTSWSPMVCFAGLGPGEVVDRRGRKLVGVSQRRTRAAARFQTVAYHAPPTLDLVNWLALDADGRAELRASLVEGTAALGVDPVRLRAALLAHLPTA